MTEDRFDEWLQRAAKGFRPPPEPPREEMWAAIVAGLEAEPDAARAPEPRARRARLRPGIGIAAILAFGIGIGRWTAQPKSPSHPPVAVTVEATADERPVTPLPYRFAAAQHLGRTEVLLTAFRVEARGGRLDPSISEWATELLTETRLLLDSPAGDDLRLRTLLQELELVLAQIARIPAAASPAEELDRLDRALHEQATLSRVRASVPAGLTSSGI